MVLKNNKILKLFKSTNSLYLFIYLLYFISICSFFLLITIPVRSLNFKTSYSFVINIYTNNSNYFYSTN